MKFVMPEKNSIILGIVSIVFFIIFVAITNYAGSDSMVIIIIIIMALSGLFIILGNWLSPTYVSYMEKKIEELKK